MNWARRTRYLWLSVVIAGFGSLVDAGYRFQRSLDVATD